MDSRIALIFWSAVLFEFKHFLCDFVLQTAYQYRNKGIYGHPGGLIHAGLHTMGSLPAVLALQAPSGIVAVFFVAEYLAHYHIDWSKEHINKRFALDARNQLYWTFFGADQMLHQLTYVVMLALLARPLFA